MTAHPNTTQESALSVPSQPVILVVEDDPALRTFLSDLLEGESYSVRCVESGTQALHALNELLPDLVLLDLCLPDLDGYTVCQKIRANSARRIPILMVSANRDPLHVLEALHVGVDDYVRKPFEVGNLLAQVRARLPLVLPAIPGETRAEAVPIMQPSAA